MSLHIARVIRAGNSDKAAKQWPWDMVPEVWRVWLSQRGIKRGDFNQSPPTQEIKNECLRLFARTDAPVKETFVTYPSQLDEFQEDMHASAAATYDDSVPDFTRPFKMQCCLDPIGRHVYNICHYILTLPS